MGPAGYPFLLQTGETADGWTPLLDRQHPHDMVMELAATWSRNLDGGNSVFVYVAPVGEPPIGPAAFMHRPSALGSPLPPIGHHFLDSTHVTHGVATVGVTSATFKIEVGAFNGGESDQNRWGLEGPRLNSVAGRVTINPHADWSLQWSLAHLDSPEQLHPGIDMQRMTASVTYNRPLARGNWQTTAAWGRNKRGSRASPAGSSTSANDLPAHLHFGPDGTIAFVTPGAIQNAWLLESTANVARWHTVYGRVERAQKDELFPPPDPRHATVYGVGRLTLGYIFDLPVETPFRMGLGVSASLMGLPSELHEAYGSSPRGFMTFFRMLLGS
jgi:hypothetical protein